MDQGHRIRYGSSMILGVIPAVAAGILANLVIVWHASLPLAIAAMTSIIVLLWPIMRAFDKTLARRGPSLAEEVAAIARINAVVESIIDRYGMSYPEINPPVKLLERPAPGISADLSSLWHNAAVSSSSLFISQMTQMPRCTLILGEPGSGKTSILLRIVHQMLADNGRHGTDLVPLFLSCRDWPGDRRQSLAGWVEMKARESYGTPESIFDYWLRRGRLVLALDGLDEVSKDHHDDLVTAINSWAHAAEGGRLIVTSRNEPAAIESRHRWLMADQVAMLQPLSDDYIRDYLGRTLARLSSQTGLSAVQGMERWIEEIITSSEYLRGPSLLGLLAKSVDETEEITGSGEFESESHDPARVAFRLGTEFLLKNDFAAARRAYSAIIGLPQSRWRGPAAALLGTCLYLLGDMEAGREAMLLSVTLRLQESVQTTPEMNAPLSDEERRCLEVLSSDVSYDLSQLSSAASLPTGRSREALQTLRDRGLVETAEGAGQRARFRRSMSAVSDF